MSAIRTVITSLPWLCLSLAMGWGTPAAAQLECSRLIAGDRQKPATGAFGYASLGSAQGRDQRCEGRIVELQGGSTGFVVDTFMIEPPWAQVQSAKMLQIIPRGVAKDKRGQVTFLGRGPESFYRMDAFIDGMQPTSWPLDPVASKIGLDWPKLRAVGRIITYGTSQVVFFPIELRVPGARQVEQEKLILRLRYTETSPKISALLGKYEQLGKCTVQSESPLVRWNHVSPFTELNVSLPITAHAQFCITLRFDIVGVDGGVRQDHASLFFVQ